MKICEVGGQDGADEQAESRLAPVVGQCKSEDVLGGQRGQQNDADELATRWAGCMACVEAATATATNRLALANGWCKSEDVLGGIGAIDGRCVH